ncbi:hypothetical protein VEE48_41820 [Escherichia coli]|nr:hypothetical protein VEE48_41820 [Escherichia coli]
MPVITLPDGSQRHYDHAVSPMDVALDIGPGLAKACIAGRVNGELVDACDLIENDAQLSIITANRRRRSGDHSSLLCAPVRARD